MVFKRAKKRNALESLKEMIWPTMGWIRTLKYMRLRVIRLPDSSHKVALGLAFGSAISFSPLVGTHFIQAAFLAWLFRSNVLAAFIGTAIGNPFTFAFLWWSGFALGTSIFRFFGWHDAPTLPEDIDFYVVVDLIKSHPMDIVLPWMVGGYLLFFITLPLFYYVYFGIIKAGRAARIKVVEHNMHHHAKKVTGQKK